VRIWTTPIAPNTRTCDTAGCRRNGARPSRRPPSILATSALHRVKAATGIDLTKLADPRTEIFQRLVGDLFALFDIMSAMLGPQLQERGMTAEQFGECLDETAAEEAATALVEAVLDFFRKRKRKLLKKAFSKVTAAAERKRNAGLDEAERKIETPEFDQAIEESLENALTSGS
jgi:hypothetical protein